MENKFPKSVNDVIIAFFEKSVNNLKEAEELAIAYLSKKGIPIIGEQTLEELLNIAVIFQPQNKILLYNNIFQTDLNKITRPTVLSAQKNHLDVVIENAKVFEQQVGLKKRTIRDSQAAISLTREKNQISILDEHFAPLLKILKKIDESTYEYDSFGIVVKFRKRIVLKYIYPSMQKSNGAIYAVVRFCRFNQDNLIKLHVPQMFWDKEGMILDVIRVHPKKQEAQLKFVELLDMCELMTYFKDKMKILYDPEQFGR